jgi:hypothetical protein
VRVSRHYRQFDAGQTGGKNDDCTVRALATARGLSYEDAWRQLYAHQGQVRACSFRLPEWLQASPEEYGVVRRLSFPARTGKPRMTGERFCDEHPRGRFVLRMAHHVVAVVDGELLDTFNSAWSCVYQAWEVAAAAREDGGR